MSGQSRIAHDYDQALALAALLDQALQQAVAPADEEPLEEPLEPAAGGVEGGASEPFSTDMAAAVAAAGTPAGDDFSDAPPAVSLAAIVATDAFGELRPTLAERLDAAIAYLRRVHCYLYYEARQCMDAGDVMHRYTD
jgi:hypothetical protein